MKLMKRLMLRSTSRQIAVGGALLATCSQAFAQTAYIAQVPAHASVGNTALVAQPAQTVPVAQNTPRQTAFVPTPELTPQRNANLATNTAYTLQIGSHNRVYQSQSGGNNFSNVGVIGGNSNNVGVWQDGKDFSNVALVNMQGYAVGVFQAPGAAPVNMLIAKLPNGGLLIKR
jgi:hypothetical protein